LVENILEKETQEKFLKIYPNPNIGSFVLETQLKGKVRIFNTLGQVVYSEFIQQNITEIVVNNHQKGIYTLEFLDEKGGISIEKIILL
jgi:hypothetical protein